MKLQVLHVSKQFDERVPALSDVRFSVGEGEFVSVIGPSGAGKTTLIRILNGSEPCDGGEVLLSGQHLESARGRKKAEIQKGVGTIYQDFALVENVSVLQNVLNAALPDMAFLPAVLGLFGRARRETAAALLARVGLADKLEEPVKNLSGGQKQRVAIARAILRESPIIILDEATANIDPENERLLSKAFENLTKDKTVIMIAHKLNTVKNADDIIVIDNGKIVEEGKHKELIKNNGIYSRFIKEREQIAGWKI